MTTSLPGTRLFERYRDEGRLLYTDFPAAWDHYDMTEVVYRPGHMDAESLSETMRRLNGRLYTWPVLIGKACRTFWSTRDKIATMFAWNSNLNYRNVGARVAA